jgi:hypothetical protein
MVPHYVKDVNGNVIDGSVQQRTLRVSLEPTVFDPLSPNYDPLAIQLGVVYISTALDINKLAMIDTRKRGGGLNDNANVQEIVRLVNDAATYWDVGYGAGTSYQKSGFIIVRLPRELEWSEGNPQGFKEKELVNIIQRNVTAGVGFKIEDLEGRDWS